MDEIIDDISDKIFLENLKTEFKITVKDNVSKLSEFFESENYSEIRRIAHDIKGVAGVFGFDKGTELAADLQKLTDNGDKIKIRNLLTELIGYLNKEVLEIKVEA
ncbi:MAG: Hpt domain-containing protein [Candidatus Aminicenantes bacterium]|nr:Hpt domain-containing protein [Candidatus Aminicenantes bacterium]MCK5003827.1 Hpt domain-containing protein [Candidatus Aminicenantes bacterium]